MPAAAASSSSLPSAPAPSAPAHAPLLAGVFAGNWAADESIAFLAESYTVFSTLATIAQRPLPGAVPSPQTLQYLSRVAGLYRSALSRYLVALTVAETTGDDDAADRSAHAARLEASLHLAQTVFLPADGEGAGVVGEELLHWVNCTDPAPSTEEGQDIASSASPHLHPAYWDYVLRCVLRGFYTSASSMLRSLSSHPSRTISSLSLEISQLLSTLPRSSSFPTEGAFTAARRTWQSSVRALLTRLEGAMDDAEAELGGNEDAEDQRLEYEAQFRCLLQLVAGERQRVFEACEDWREALGAWGTLVQPTMRRDDVPETMAVILEQFPVDAKIPGESLLCALASGSVREACRIVKDFDAWLAAHLIDLFDKAGLLDASMGMSVDARTDALLQYAETLLDDSGLWRMSVDYLAAVGTAAAATRLRNVILDVPLSDEEAGNTVPARTLDALEDEAREAEMIDDADDPEQAAEALRREKERQQRESGTGTGFRGVEEVLKACVEHGLEEEARAVCKRVAKLTAAKRQYGLAIAYCVRAGDARQVRRIADALLDEYITRGADEFCRLVDSIPASLLNPAASRPPQAPGSSASAEGMELDAAGDAANDTGYGAGRSLFSSRLAFLAGYRDFHRLYAEEQLRAAAELLVVLLTSNAAPERFWAVLLVDAIPLLEGSDNLFTADETFELLRFLEQINSGLLSGSSDAQHFLGLLEQLLSASSSGEGPDSGRSVDVCAARQRLDIVRLGLARQLARASVTGVGVL